MVKIAYAFLSGMVVLLIVMYISLSINSGKSEEKDVIVEHPKYHLQFLVQNRDENFWINFKNGAQVAADDYGVYVEFVPIEKFGVDKLREAVEMGVNEGVDGIALQAVDTLETQKIINYAKSQGVTIIAYENKNYVLSETPMVGTNSYSLGCYAGNMAIEATGGKADVAVIINNVDNDGVEEYKNLIIQGMLDSFSAYSTMNVSENNIYTVNTEMFEAEEVASKIINRSHKPSLIICLDEKCTPGIAQILVDNNLVGDIKLVGYGITAQTLEYINHGVIYGTICPDANDIGYYSVKQLVQALEGEQISDSVSTGLFTINRQNVEHYIESLKMN